MVLAHNLAFNKYDGYLERSRRYLDQFVADSGWTTAATVYGGTIDMMVIRDKGLANLLNVSSGVNTLSLGIFGSSPKDKAQDKFEKYVSQGTRVDSMSVLYHIHRLTAAVESADVLSDLLGYASADLLWLKAHYDSLSQVEIFLYRLSWAKYAYRYIQKYDTMSVEEKITELNKGLNWLESALPYVCSAGMCRDWDFWEQQLSTLRTKLITDGG